MCTEKKHTYVRIERAKATNAIALPEECIMRKLHNHNELTHTHFVILFLFVCLFIFDVNAIAVVVAFVADAFHLINAINFKQLRKDFDEMK